MPTSRSGSPVFHALRIIRLAKNIASASSKWPSVSNFFPSLCRCARAPITQLIALRVRCVTRRAGRSCFALRVRGILSPSWGAEWLRHPTSRNALHHCRLDRISAANSRRLDVPVWGAYESLIENPHSRTGLQRHNSLCKFVRLLHAQLFAPNVCSLAHVMLRSNAVDRVFSRRDDERQIEHDPVQRGGCS